MVGTPLSIRISEDTRQKMKELDIDWSEYIRTAIENKIREYQRKKAAESMDAIRKKTVRGSFDSTRAIREDRDSNHA